MKILSTWLREYLSPFPADDHQLADDLTLRGIAVEGVHSLGPSSSGQPNGHLFEMDITTNRVDAMNHYGIAREAATIYNVALKPLDTSLPQAAPAKSFAVTIEAPDLCGRFTARVIRGVTIGQSSGAVAKHFGALDQKLISNAVDASNYILLAMGHPTHAFDLDKLEGGIVVRRARRGEKLKLLDGTERTLEADDLVVADEKKAVGLAGVMGGWDTMITPETKNILVEAAWFDPASIRCSSRRHGIHSDASHRFERGADFNAALSANALVSKLILEACGGSLEGDLVDVVIPEAAAKTANRPAIALSVAAVRRHLGSTQDGKGIPAEIVERYLTALGCKLAPTGTETYAVTLPSWRLDLEREIDLIEEVARVYGYNRFANTLPAALPVIAHPLAAAEAAVRTRLLALGYSEAISSTFASDADGQAFFAATPGISRGVVAMENPLSEEARLLRPSLVPGMVAMLAHNLNRDVREVRLFEQSEVFTGTADDAGAIGEVTESASLSLGLTGDLAATPLHTAKDAAIFELKGVIESLLSLFATSTETLSTSAASALTFANEAPSWLEPGRSATALLGGTAIARFGELATTQREPRKLRQPVYLAEIDLATLYTLPLRRATARELSRFQAVERDFSFTFADPITWQTVAQTIEALGIAQLQRLVPVEIFRDAKGTSVPPGHYALLLRCTFQSPERTLREDELTEWWAKIIAALTSLGGTIRA
jgi:phenylalanyl-tRNA synthetase beta chain